MEISSLVTYIKARLMQVKAASWLRLKVLYRHTSEILQVWCQTTTVKYFAIRGAF